MEWESFARGIWPEGATADPAELRDEAEDILRATAVDMQSDQTGPQQAEKSKGGSRQEGDGDVLTRASSSTEGPAGIGFRGVGSGRRIPCSSRKRAPTVAREQTNPRPV